MKLAFNEHEMSMRIRFEQPVSDEELLRFSSANEPWRVERDSNGELIVMTLIHSDGGAIEGAVYAELHIGARVDGRGKPFGPNAGFTLPDTSIRAADVAWISWDRRNALSLDQQQSYAPICPEFVIEVRSHSDRLLTIEAKMEMWISNGAELAWLIDPKQKMVAVYRPGGEPELFHEPTSVQGTGPVAGFEVVMSRIWQ